MGLTVYFYKNPLGDCTNGGVSSKFTEGVVVNVDGPSKPRDDAPAMLLVKGYAPGTVRIVPADVGTGRSMFGGNYAATSDSRFSEALEKLLGHRFYGAVAVHDRFER